MTGEDYFIYIGRSDRLSIKTMSPVKTEGRADSYFPDRSIDHYWRVKYGDRSSFLNAIGNGINAGCDIETAQTLLLRSDYDSNDVLGYFENEIGADVDINEEQITVSDGNKEVVSMGLISAFMEWYAHEVETDESNDSEETL